MPQLMLETLPGGAVDTGRPFTVDVRRFVDLMMRHAYASPGVYLRELLQNGTDAITARRLRAAERGEKPDPTWGITITPAGTPLGQFTFADQGIGMAFEQAADLLATVGNSSNRDIIGLARTDLIGRGGIGLLSCFLVADQIRVVTHPASGGSGAEWVGSIDGTFFARPLPRPGPAGTQVFLSPRPDTAVWLSGATVGQLAGEYGQHLPVPINIVTTKLDDTDPDDSAPAQSPLVGQRPVFLEKDANYDRLITWCESAFGFAPFDVIDVEVPGTQTYGKAFVRTRRVSPGTDHDSIVYAGRLLVSREVHNLMPDWAFFVSVAVNSDGLNTTIGRDTLMADYGLEHTREQLGILVRGWLANMALKQPNRFKLFMEIHELAFKQLVLDDQEAAGFFAGYLSVETPAGWVRLDRLVEASPQVFYARTTEEFHLVRRLNRHVPLLVNGGNLFDAELMELLPRVYPYAIPTPVSLATEVAQLHRPGPKERPKADGLAREAGRVLATRRCQVIVRQIPDQDTVALYLADPRQSPGTNRRYATDDDVRRALDDTLPTVDPLPPTTSDPAAPASRLLLNWSNPLIRTLARHPDRTAVSRAIQLIYVQAQLTGHYQLSQPDARLMTTSLSDLLALIDHADESLDNAIGDWG